MPRTTSRPTPNMTEVDPDYLLGTFNAKQEFELNEQIAHGTGLNSRDPIAIYKQDIVVPFEGHMGMIALTVPQGSQPVSRDACRALREVTVEQDGMFFALINYLASPLLFPIFLISYDMH